MRIGLAMAAVLAAACGTPSPLSRELDVGRDAYAVFVGDARGGTDLYAVPGRGGQAIPLSYSPVNELAPAMAPDGGTLAFLREAPSGTRSVWVMNLLSGAEREVSLPDSVAPPERVAWSSDGRTIYVRTVAGGVWQAAAPPARSDSRIIPAGPETDSAFAVLLGDPVFAEVGRCSAPGEHTAICVITPDGEAPLAAGAAEAARWGRDSVAYLADGELMVRPLGPGKVRPVEMDQVPARIRELTAFGGAR